MFLSKKFGEALVLFNELFQKTGNPEFLFKIGVCYQELENFSEAAAIFKKLLHLKDDLEFISEPVLTDKLFYCYVKLNNVNELNKLISNYNLNIDNINLYLSYCEVLLKNKQFERANAEYERIIDIDRNNIKALFGLAKIKDILKEYKTAVIIYNKILSLKPNFTDVYYELGKVHKKNGDHINAIEILMKGLNIAGGDLLFNMITLLSNCFFESEEYEAAIEHLMFGINQFKKDSAKKLELNYLLGKAYYFTNKKDDAVKLWKEIYKQNAEYSDVAELLKKNFPSRNINQILSVLKNLDKTSFHNLMTELSNKFHISIVSYEYKKNTEIILIGKEAANKSIISIKLWDNPAGDIALFDFKELLNLNQAKRGILIIPNGFIKQMHPSNLSEEFNNITIIQKNQFTDLFNELLRMV
ncbi:tetratricopeptide repeat protein [Candidatus Dependentiae bacterium]|nr:tetratricopeptide repeat protein [Candidatus Dependentiae bacterium]